MTERERLISILENARMEAGDTMGSMNGGIAAWYADKLLEAGVTLNQWIPATERLPEDPDMFVLVVCSGMYKGIGFDDAYELATYNPEEGWISELYPEASVAVTHWMPLPEPPKMGG